jgi:hypothetical protein
LHSPWGSLSRRRYNLKSVNNIHGNNVANIASIITTTSRLDFIFSVAMQDPGAKICFARSAQ